MMRPHAAKWLFLLATLVPWTSVSAREALRSVQTTECGGPVDDTVAISKSPVLQNSAGSIRAILQVSYRHNSADAARKRCHVSYKLFVSVKGNPFVAAKELGWDTEDGEIAGIDMVGFSPDGTNFAVDFWLAEGDGIEHRPVVYSLVAHSAMYRPLGSRIQGRIHGCDQVEAFIGVTDSGEAIFTVPPSTYDDSPGCGDKGVWQFNLVTGRVKQVAKVSGDKWK